MSMVPVKKVLLVDDSVTTLFMAQVLLGELTGVHLLTAVDGEQAVSVALHEKPDLILMDLVMPHMNGIQACRVIRSSPDTKDIPVILVTVRGDESGNLQGYESGCTALITKPFNGAELVALVKAHLDDGRECSR
jgi:DNA-binding response OmpR family regulator